MDTVWTGMVMVLLIHMISKTTIYSAANYLSISGAADGDYEKAIFNYNHSEKYVQDVLRFFNDFEVQRLEMEEAN